MINPTGCGGLASDTAADGQRTESRLWTHREQEALHFLRLSTEKMASGWFEQQPCLFHPDVTGHPGCCVMTTGERICVCLTLVFVAVGQHYRNRKKKRRLRVELWSMAKRTGASFGELTPRATTSQSAAAGSCRWTHHVTLSAALPPHCSSEHSHRKSLYKQEHWAGGSRFL